MPLAQLLEPMVVLVWLLEQQLPLAAKELAPDVRRLGLLRPCWPGCLQQAVPTIVEQLALVVLKE